MCVSGCACLREATSGAETVRYAAEITGLFLPFQTLRDHANPVVQLDHLDLTARGLPLTEGARQFPDRRHEEPLELPPDITGSFRSLTQTLRIRLAARLRAEKDVSPPTPEPVATERSAIWWAYPRRRPPLRAALEVSVGRCAEPLQALTPCRPGYRGAGFEPATFGSLSPTSYQAAPLRGGPVVIARWERLFKAVREHEVYRSQRCPRECACASAFETLLSYQFEASSVCY
jgi:hypothetical protein